MLSIPGCDMDKNISDLFQCYFTELFLQYFLCCYISLSLHSMTVSKMSSYVQSWIPVRKLRNVPSQMCWNLQLPVNTGILRMFVTEMSLALKSNNFNSGKSYIVTKRVYYLEVQTLKFGNFFSRHDMHIVSLLRSRLRVDVFNAYTSNIE